MIRGRLKTAYRLVAAGFCKSKKRPSEKRRSVFQTASASSVGNKRTEPQFQTFVFHFEQQVDVRMFARIGLRALLGTVLPTLGAAGGTDGTSEASDADAADDVAESPEMRGEEKP